MSQIQKGVTFSTGMVVTGDNLNAHVDGAILLSGAITDQASGLASGSDLLLVSKNNSLKKVTVQSVIDIQPVRAFVYFEYNYNGNSIIIRNQNNVSAVNLVTAGSGGAIFTVNFLQPFSNIYYNMNGISSVQKDTVAVPVSFGKPTAYPWSDAVDSSRLQVTFGQPLETTGQTIIVMANFIGN